MTEADKKAVQDLIRAGGTMPQVLAKFPHLRTELPAVAQAIVETARPAECHSAPDK